MRREKKFLRVRLGCISSIFCQTLAGIRPVEGNVSPVFFGLSDEPETRDAWWSEVRTEIRSHARAMGCNAVIGYYESTSIW